MRLITGFTIVGKMIKNPDASEEEIKEYLKKFKDI